MRHWVLTGDVVPVDGRLVTAATLDESTLTGESLPVERAAGEVARSSAVNAGASFDLLATATADESTYAGLVRLVEQAQAGSAPSSGWPTGWPSPSSRSRCCWPVPPGRCPRTRCGRWRCSWSRPRAR